MMTGDIGARRIKQGLTDFRRGWGLEGAPGADRPPKTGRAFSPMALALHRDRYPEGPAGGRGTGDRHGLAGIAALLSALGVRGQAQNKHAQRIAQLNGGPGSQHGR